MRTHLYTTAPLPKLATLHTKPTWHNRAGRIDRSACFVLTAAPLWRQLHPDDWTYRYPARQPAYHAKGKCDRYATRTLWARDLWLLHKWEQPYPLQGDFRSAKTNALRHTPRPIDQRGDRPCAQHMRHDAILGHGPTNPNRGVGFNMYKRLGLPCMWQTTLRIERYVQHHQLKQHFLVCPVCGHLNDGSGGMGVPPVIEQPQNDGRHGHPTQAKKRPAKLPAGRVTKLYLPLCTEREYEDAHFAQLWLKTHVHPNRPHTPDALQLINRYSELFEPRNLRCRQCLSLRYGEVKRSTGSMAGRGSRRTGGCLRVAARQEPRPPAERRLTEQTLFLTNLPKLLAPVPDASPTQRRRGVASNQSSISYHQSIRPACTKPSRRAIQEERLLIEILVPIKGPVLLSGNRPRTAIGKRHIAGALVPYRHVELHTRRPGAVCNLAQVSGRGVGI